MGRKAKGLLKGKAAGCLGTTCSPVENASGGSHGKVLRQEGGLVRALRRRVSPFHNGRGNTLCPAHKSAGALICPSLSCRARPFRWAKRGGIAKGLKLEFLDPRLERLYVRLLKGWANGVARSAIELISAGGAVFPDVALMGQPLPHFEHPPPCYGSFNVFVLAHPAASRTSSLYRKPFQPFLEPLDGKPQGDEGRVLKGGVG